MNIFEKINIQGKSIYLIGGSFENIQIFKSSKYKSLY